MKGTTLALALLVAVLGPLLGSSPGDAVTKNVTLEIPQDTLNRLVTRLGTPSGDGTHQASGGLVPWRWVVTGARFTMATGSMTFSATVDATVAGTLTRVTRTVPAAMTFDASAGKLRATISPFTVPVQSAGTTIVQVDVARLHSLAVPIEPQEIAVPLLDGDTREVRMAAAAAAAEYSHGKVIITFDMAAARPPSDTGPPGARLRPARALPVPAGGAGPTTGRGTVRVYESMLNELAKQIEPLRLSGHYQFKRGCGCAPVVGCGCAISVSCDWTARVRDVRFDIKPSGIHVRGDVRASWCDQSFEAAASTTADVGYVRSVLVGPALGRLRGHEAWLAIHTSPTDIQPVFRIQGYEVKLPIRINVGPSMSWRIPVSTSLVDCETAGGPLRLRLSPADVNLIKRHGYLEAQANVSLW